jgi:hypothetical protein
MSGFPFPGGMPNANFGFGPNGPYGSFGWGQQGQQGQPSNTMGQGAGGAGGGGTDASGRPLLNPYSRPQALGQHVNTVPNNGLGYGGMGGGYGSSGSGMSMYGGPRLKGQNPSGGWGY